MVVSAIGGGARVQAPSGRSVPGHPSCDLCDSRSRFRIIAASLAGPEDCGRKCTVP